MYAIEGNFEMSLSAWEAPVECASLPAEWILTANPLTDLNIVRSFKPMLPKGRVLHLPDSKLPSSPLALKLPLPRPPPREDRLGSAERRRRGRDDQSAGTCFASNSSSCLTPPCPTQELAYFSDTECIHPIVNDAFALVYVNAPGWSYQHRYTNVSTAVGDSDIGGYRVALDPPRATMHFTPPAIGKCVRLPGLWTLSADGSSGTVGSVMPCGPVTPPVPPPAAHHLGYAIAGAALAVIAAAVMAWRREKQWQVRQRTEMEAKLLQEQETPDELDAEPARL
jgi:hypothetical protein